MYSINTTDKVISLIFEYLYRNSDLDNINNAFDIKSGYAFKSTTYTENEENGILNFRVTNINSNGSINLDNSKYIDKKVAGDFDKYLLNEGDVLLVMVGGSLGKVGYVDGSILPALMNQNMWRFVPNSGFNFNSRFIFYLIKYIVGNKLEVRNSGHGHLSKAVFQKNDIPLVNIDIQIKVSNYLDNLNNGIINEFGIKELDIIINDLLQSDLNINQLFELISKSKEYITNLKQSILQEAIEGKLTKLWREENKDIESASVLLEKIKVEKEELIKQKKIKKQKDLKEIDESEIPFDIPTTWSSVRLGDICNNIHYGFNASADHNNLDIRLLRITDIQNDKVNWANVPGCIINIKDVEKYKLSKNDILIARTGGTIGKSYIVKDLNVSSVFASYLIRLIPNTLINADFLKKYLGSNFYWDQLIENSGGAAQPNVNGTALSNLIFSLPPIEEQKEIVKKVDELMKLCDELEKQTGEIKENSENLMKAVLGEVFNK